MTGVPTVVAASVVGLLVLAAAVVVGLRLYWERCQDRAPAVVQAQLDTMQLHRTTHDLSGAARESRTSRRTGRPAPALRSNPAWAYRQGNVTTDVMADVGTGGTPTGDTSECRPPHSQGKSTVSAPPTR